MKTICLTGCAGFIGSHVLEMLLKRGYYVVGIDNLLHENGMKNIREIVTTAGQFSLHVVDVRDRDKISNILTSTKFDAVIHLAGLAGVRKSIENPQEYVDVNVNGTLSMLDACVESNTSRFIFASSSSVYGDWDGFLSEDMQLAPQSPYAASKASAEMLCLAYKNCFNIQTLALRFFTAYGPRNRSDMMAHKILDNIYMNKPLTVYENGNMTRDWTYVEDIANYVINAIDNPVTGVLNLGSETPTLLSEFIKQIEIETEKKCNFTSSKAPKADVSSTWSSTQKAFNHQIINQHTSLNDGIKKLVEWYKFSVLGVIGRTEFEFKY